MSFLAYAGIALILVAVVLVFLRRSRQAKLLEIGSTETQTARELEESARYVAERMGQPGNFRKVVEVKGIIRCDSPLVSEVAGQECVYYSMSVRRERETTRWVENSQSGNREQRTERHWDTVASNSRRIPFWVEDATGRVLVRPDGADMDAETVVNRYDPATSISGGVLSHGDFRLEIGSGLGGMFSDSRTLGYEITERLIPLGRPIYVLGEASDGAGKPEIQKPGEKGRKFIISLKSEEELIRSVQSALRWMTLGAGASGVAGVALLVIGLLRR